MEQNNFNIPISDIFKVHLLDNMGITRKIFVFCRNTMNIKFNNELFSSFEKEKIEKKELEVIFSNGLIHKDDSISIIKKKIINEIGIQEISYDEMYFFIKKKHSIHINTLYKSITQNEKNQLNNDIIKQLFLNFNIENTDLLNNNREQNQNMKNDTIYTLDEFKNLMNESLMNEYHDNKELSFNISVPLGQRFSNEFNYLFSANPYKINSETIGFLNYNDNSLLLFDNDLLLNYGDIHGNNIYLCRTKDVLENTTKNSEYMFQTYFPLLYRNSITSIDDFKKEKQKLLKSNTDIINKDTQYLFDSVYIFYDIFYGRNDIELPYVNKGINQIKMKIKTELNISLPLEVIFKNIHSTKIIPFIKYNPGNRRENIYRLYTEKKTADGKNIPFLSESTITKLSKEIGKKKQISLFIQHNYNDEIINVFMDIEINGDLTIYFDLKNPLSMDEIDKLVKNIVNPFVNNINGFLDQTGYKIKNIESINDNYIEIENIHYITEFILEKELNLNKYTSCLTSIFDIIDEDVIKGTKMCFKRVENFKEMDSQTLMITNVFKKTNDVNTVIIELMKNYKMTENAAQLRMVEYLGEHKDIRGKIVDNPGFPVLFLISKLDKKLTIEVTDIDSFDYIEILSIYFDSILRITQQPDSTSVKKNDILKLCSKNKIIKQVPHLENVISTTIIDPVINIPKKIQPIGFDDDMDDDIEEGIFFDEDEEYLNFEEPIIEEVMEEAEEESMEEPMEEPVEEAEEEPVEEPVEEKNESIIDSIKTFVGLDKEETKSPEGEETKSPEEEETKSPEEEETKSPEEEETKSPEEEETKSPEEEETESPEEEETKSPEEEETESPEEEETKSPENNKSIIDSIKSFVGLDNEEEKKIPTPTPTSLSTNNSTNESKGIFFDDDEEDEDEIQKTIPKNKEEEKKIPTPTPTSISTNNSSNESKGIFFDDDEEDEDEIQKTIPKNKEEKKGGDDTNYSDSENENETEEDKEYFVNPVGKTLKHPNLFYTMMKKRDPELFAIEEDKNYTSYSRVCASNLKLQPVILSKSEFEKINKENPDSYSDYIKYGSDPNKPYYYICPRYWCLLNNTSMTEEDVKAGKCAKKGVPDKIIPPNAKVVPNDAFVYEFNNPKQHLNEKGEYIPHFPGFKKGNHPKGFGLPCCFKKQKQNWEFNQEELKPKRGRPPIKKGIEIDENEKNKTYIISNETFPIRQRNRFGFLPLSVQYFLQTDNNNCVTNNNSALIKPNTECILRYGVEQIPNQSILGSIAELYAYSQELQTTPSVNELKQIIKNSITIDKFIYYNNSYLVSVFRPKKMDYTLDTSKYENSEFYKKLNLDNENENDFFEDTVASYENFMNFILSDDSKIDHAYLWDMITDDNSSFIKGGINLVIIEITNNDITENMKILCPTNSNARKMYDPRKETMIIIKKDEFYEPIFLYKDVNGKISKTRTFYQQIHLKNIKKILNIIEKSMNLKCGSQPSLPKIYHFKKNRNLDELIIQITQINYLITTQVLNYQGKIIGVVVKKDEESESYVFLPCFPSSELKELKDIPKQWMDEEDIWTDYKTTVDELNNISEISKKNILCLPKIKVLEDNLIVGILTETNQFIQIVPPSENILYDNLPSISSTNYLKADKVITTTKKIDTEREKMIQKISLESQFYYIFRSTIRNYLNQYENRDIKDKIVNIINNEQISYKQKLQTIQKMIHDIISFKFIFSDIDEKVLLKYKEVSCSPIDCEERSDLCIRKEDGICQIVIPKNHLISGYDNEKIYYGRISDELVRYKRIQLFMLQPKTYLNMTNVEYKINENEFIIIQSSIQNDYLKNLIPFNNSSNISHLNYDNAKPQFSQTYTNEPIKVNEQYQEYQKKDFKLSDYIFECVKETKDVIGNSNTSYWKRLFPSKTKEIIFKNTSFECSFYILLYIFQDKYREPISVQSIKITLWNGYKEIYSKYKETILKILKKQGKHDMVQKIKNNSYSLETAIMSNEYYITDLDIWVFAQNAKIQVCLFSTFKLKGFDESLEWITMGKNYKEKHYFIRSPTNILTNKVSSYNLIMPSFSLGEIPDFEKQLQGILTGRIEGSLSNKNIQTLQNYLENYER